MIFFAAVAISIAAFLGFLFNPALGVASIFIAKPIVDATWGQILFWGMPLTQVVAGVVPVCLLLHMTIAQSDASISRMPLKWIWIAYAGYLSTVVWITIGQQDMLLGANVSFRTLNGFIGFYMVQAFCHDERRIKQLLMAMVVAGLFPVGVGIYQAATGVAWHGESQEIEGILRNSGLYHDVITVRHYAFQTTLALLLLGALSPFGSLLSNGFRLLYLSAATLVMFKAYSKAGLLLFGLWGLCWTVLQRKVWTLILLMAAGVGFAFFVASDLTGNVMTIFHKEIGFLGGRVEVDRTLNGRWYIWQNMLTEWAKLDWTGMLFGSGKVGLGAHNDYLQVLFHGGLVGLALYVMLLIAIGVRIVLDLWRRIDPLAVAALMVFLSWMIDTIGLVPSAYSGYQWFVWGMIGLSLRVRQDEKRRVEPGDTISSRSTISVSSFAIPDVTAGRRFPLVSR